MVGGVLNDTNKENFVDVKNMSEKEIESIALEALGRHLSITQSPS